MNKDEQNQSNTNATEANNGHASSQVAGSEAEGISESVTDDRLEKKLAEAVAHAIKEQEQKYLYLYADFENFKKRVSREKSDLLKFGNERLIRELLQVSDNLERALQYSSPSEDGNSASLLDGVKMVNAQLKEVLNKFGLKPVEASGQKFDPMVHEAVAQESSAEVEEGFVIREEQKGYLLHDRLLRPARVVVAKKIN